MAHFLFIFYSEMDFPAHYSDRMNTDENTFGSVTVAFTAQCMWADEEKRKLRSDPNSLRKSYRKRCHRWSHFKINANHLQTAASFHFGLPVLLSEYCSSSLRPESLTYLVSLRHVETRNGNRHKRNRHGHRQRKSLIIRFHCICCGEMYRV